MPEISVIMGVYNELNKDILMEAVNSILHQTFEDFEFIIYDDGSCPEAATLLREVEGLDERIKLIGQDENHGLAFSLNACIDEAKGKYIARMDADDISYPERLMKQKKIFGQNIRSIHGLAAILMCLIRMEYGESAKCRNSL